MESNQAIQFTVSEVNSELAQARGPNPSGRKYSKEY